MVQQFTIVLMLVWFKVIYQQRQSDILALTRVYQNQIQNFIDIQVSHKIMNNGLEATSKKIQNYIFKFSDLIGTGNFSKVYKAQHEITNQVVAVKIIQLNSLKSAKLQELLFSQIDVLKKLNHPNILRCFEVFTSNRNCYIITELCNGGDLQNKLRKQHHFKQNQAQPLIKDIFSGLLYLTEKNVIHRDLKVANIFLHNGRAKIADFGFAKFTKQRFKDINIGSPIYMSPEGLIHNYYGPKTDVWAFGILLFQMLQGQTPYAFCQTEKQLKYYISVPISKTQIKADVSNDIKQFILRCMQVDEQKRPSFTQLKNTPYIRKIMLNSSEMEGKPIKISSDKNLHLNYLNNKVIPKDSNEDIGVQTRVRNGMMVQKQKSFSPININENRNLSSNNRNKVQNNLTQNLHKKGISVEKFLINKQNEQQNTENIKNTSKRQLKLIQSSLTFKESVNLLHYCRLLYKHFVALKQSSYSDQRQLSTLSIWLIKILKEMNAKIQNKQIIYQGDNVWLRQKKLKQVASEYSKKYTTEIGIYCKKSKQVNIDSVNRSFRIMFNDIDTQIAKQSNRILLALGHSIIVICDATKMLKKCIQQSNYKQFELYRDIENFLNMNKDNMDIQSYVLFRKKLHFLNKQ